MKRFSVLLVVAVFLMPLVVYGLSGNFDYNSNDKGLMPESSLGVVHQDAYQEREARDVPAGVASNASVQRDEEPEPPVPPDIHDRELKEEMFPPPPGTKGIISKIDVERNIIHLENVIYVDPRTNMEATDDFKIRIQASTAFYHDLQPVADLSHLVEGMEIICQGRINYASKIMDFTNAIYSGAHYSPDLYDYLHFSGPVEAIDWDNNQFIVSSKIFPFQAVDEPFAIRLSPSTVVWVRSLDDTQATQFQNGVIPEDFKEYMIIEGSAEFFYGKDYCTAVDITFVLFDN